MSKKISEFGNWPVPFKHFEGGGFLSGKELVQDCLKHKVTSWHCTQCGGNVKSSRTKKCAWCGKVP